jgi:RNA recognition motif-containing protein
MRIGNLPYDCDKIDVRKFLSKCGAMMGLHVFLVMRTHSPRAEPIASVRMLTRRGTGLSRGCCFVEFSSEAGLRVRDEFVMV